MVHEAASIGFGRAADAYDRGRPDYPDAAIDWLWNALGLRAGDPVADVGAGTGKLTEALLDRGAEVTAVEPVDAMRERLAGSLPRAAALAGTAERLPLTGASVAAVVAGQAFHWFANERALGEFERVLRPSGRLGLVWNRRRAGDPLQDVLSELLARHRGDTPEHASERWRPALEGNTVFEPLGASKTDFVHELGVEGLVDRIASVSFVAALASEPRAELLERVRALGERHAPVRLPYTCEAFVYGRCE